MKPLSLLLLPFLVGASLFCFGTAQRERPVLLDGQTTKASRTETAIDAFKQTAPPDGNQLLDGSVPDQEIFDLYLNRHLAHRQLGGGLWIDAGAPGFSRYVHGNRGQHWAMNRTLDERPVAVPARTELSLYLPLTASQVATAEVLVIRLWYRSGRGSLDVSLAGEPLGEIALEAGWQTVQVPLPPGLLATGDNLLTLSWPRDGVGQGERIRGALESLFIGPAAALGMQDGPGGSRPEPTLAGDRIWTRGFPLGPREGLAWYLVLPERAFLRMSADGYPADDCQMLVRVLPENGPVLEYAVDLGLSGGDRRDDDFTLLLERAPRGQVVRLELELQGTCTNLVVRRAGIRVPGPMSVPEEFPPPRNVVVWLIDALRADRLRTIEPTSRVVTPNLDRFAAEGVVFTQAYVQGNSSFASHAAIFAGRYPESMEVLSSRDHVRSSEELLAELLGRSGRFAGGYSSNGHIRSSNGFEQGFDTFVNTLRDNYRYLADGLVSHASRWLDQHGQQPFYLFVGTVDCHVTYRSHEDILPLYDPAPYDGPFMRTVGGDELGLIKSGEMEITERDRIRMQAIYDDDVTYSDRYFGLFLDDLRARGILDETLVVVLSDHGDEFFEHGSVGHGHSVYQELIHIPLLMRYPPAIPAGTVVDQAVESIDLLPTLADLVGVAPSDEIQGESLMGLIHGADRHFPRPAISQNHGHHHVMLLHHYKLFWFPDGTRRLYDLSADPTEQEDVADAHPFALRWLTDAMGLWMAYRQEWAKATWGVPSNLRQGFAP